MATEYPADYLIDRSRLRRKLSFWRVATVALFLVAAGVGAYRWSDGLRSATSSSHIARLSLGGVLTGNQDTLKLIDDIGKSNAAGVIVSIESPGGTTTGAERIYDELRRLSEKKPTVAVVGTMAASGGYIAAMGTDRIFARGTSLVGSIGVLFQFPNVSKVLDTVGVKMETIKSSPLKASPDGFEPTSPEARAAIASIVSDSYDWFKGLVKDRRKLDDKELAVVADGRVFTARQGLPLKLVDEIGGEREAIAWMERERHVAKDLPVREWRRSSATNYLGLFGSAADLADAAGLGSIAQVIRSVGSNAEAHMLDGLVAVWHSSDLY
ncbi:MULTISPECIES: signal peptide peptidase SppA [unclassified Beijerinckia]|uniref:signal peptide peptidase SppA n=1 Tax=unclassified Beijerinckia TaxID=2638183 RepID=UPI000894516C|nr:MULTISPECIES: signal peptide peptidase SppA [unclassified Beijerinckia]MDH7796732.1 protease-4 [Beijerinckia sp. GAS462]SEC57618.1 protease-4 [Beijerinckia sp. 28-YEA-48]